MKTEVGDTAESTGSLDVWTEDEALSSLRYDRTPLLTMRVADLRDALSKSGLSHAGNQRELRVRLARRLCSDLAAGAPGLASMEGFEVASSAAASGAPVSVSEAPSARGARLQRRRTSTLLKKGPDTRDSPIVISGSDDESDVSAAAAEAPAAAASAAAASTSAEAPAPSPTPGRRGKRTRAARDADETPQAEAKGTKTKPQGKALADMSFADLQKEVKALGLKPKGRKRSDLEDCLRKAAKEGAPQEEGEEGRGAKAGVGVEVGKRGRGRTPVPANDSGASLSLSIEGTAIKDMKVIIVLSYATLRSFGLIPRPLLLLGIGCDAGCRTQRVRRDCCDCCDCCLYFTPPSGAVCFMY